MFDFFRKIGRLQKPFIHFKFQKALEKKFIASITAEKIVSTANDDKNRNSLDSRFSIMDDKKKVDAADKYEIFSQVTSTFSIASRNLWSFQLVELAEREKTESCERKESTESRIVIYFVSSSCGYWICRSEIIEDE